MYLGRFSSKCKEYPQTRWSNTPPAWQHLQAAIAPWGQKNTRLAQQAPTTGILSRRGGYSQTEKLGALAWLAATIWLLAVALALRLIIVTAVCCAVLAFAVLAFTLGAGLKKA